MPVLPNHIKNFIVSESETKHKSELIELLLKRVNKLCFDECQIDRISCTITPMCYRRFLLKLRIKNGLPIEDLPQFCYSVHKGVIEREYRNKTVVYRPFDSYLYLVDFLDIFFHGDYRRLNRYISKKTLRNFLGISFPVSISPSLISFSNLFFINISNSFCSIIHSTPCS